MNIPLNIFCWATLSHYLLSSQPCSVAHSLTLHSYLFTYLIYSCHTLWKQMGWRLLKELGLRMTVMLTHFSKSLCIDLSVLTAYNSRWMLCNTSEVELYSQDIVDSSQRLFQGIVCTPVLALRGRKIEYINWKGIPSNVQNKPLYHFWSFISSSKLPFYKLPFYILFSPNGFNFSVFNLIICRAKYFIRYQIKLNAEKDWPVSNAKIKYKLWSSSKIIEL